MRPELVTPPSALPVTTQEAKEHTIIDFGDDDGLVERLIAAATHHLDGYTGILGRCMVSQDWRQDFAGWASCLRLPFPDVTAASIEYTDADGNPQTVTATDYRLMEDARGAYIRFQMGFARPTLDSDDPAPVRVTFTAGYGGAAAVPWDIKAAICMLVAHWYETRAAASDKAQRPVPFAVDALLAKRRWVTV